jgi:hypothetical protein
MSDRQNSAGDNTIVSRNAARDRFASALRLYVGRGRRYTAKEMERGTGIPARMIEAFTVDYGLTEHRTPRIEQLLSLAKFLGPEFTTEWLGLSEQGAFWLPDTDDQPPGALAADNAEDNAKLTRAALDGVFDENEKPDLKVVGTRMMARGATLRRMAA